MNNILLGLLSIVITFSLLIIVEKVFKKEGLYVWISIATIIANVIICKSIDVFGYVTNIGNVLFASTFLATDIMIEKYSKEDSKKAILIGVVSQIIFLIMTQYALLYVPASTDLAQELPKDRAPRACGRNSTPTYPLSWIQTHKDAKKSRKTRRHKDIHNSETREHNESFGNSEVHTDTQR